MSINLYPDQEVMQEEQINSLFREVQDGMSKYVVPSLVEAYYPSVADPEFMENGTGAFVDVDGKKLLVSNDHVIKQHGLRHSFYGFNGFIQAAAQRYGIDAPIDIGAATVLDRNWKQFGADASPIAFGKFAEKHQTVPHEILWTAGYPGARVKQFSNLTFSVCQAFPTQEYVFHDGAEPHEEFDANYHFALAYSPENAQLIDKTGISDSPGLSDPHGLSGSLVWNTRRIECFYLNEPWTPNMAIVTGIVWAWPKSNYLIVTKVEHIREFLLEASNLPSASN